MSKRTLVTLDGKLQTVVVSGNKRALFTERFDLGTMYENQLLYLTSTGFPVTCDLNGAGYMAGQTFSPLIEHDFKIAQLRLGRWNDGNPALVARCWLAEVVMIPDPPYYYFDWLDHVDVPYNSIPKWTFGQAGAMIDFKFASSHHLEVGTLYGVGIGLPGGSVMDDMIVALVKDGNPYPRGNYYTWVFTGWNEQTSDLCFAEYGD
jgi:hypothetical protein